ncbi:MAG: type I pantothenate kinase [Nitriliruptorales bacterium]|nr:type I pantothenate kinase [Nitriliruptorales bacterium]
MEELPSSAWLRFDRSEWAELRRATPLTLDESDLEALRGINEQISLAEVTEIYLPLSRLLNLYVAATQDLHRAADHFLGDPAGQRDWRHTPYIIGLAGSVAVGKSTIARILQALLSRWQDHPEVALVTTDGFLYPNEVLEERGMLGRKGFPESYDVGALVQFVAARKSGADEVRAPVYSHLTYDIVPDEEIVVRRPDIVILEGLNVLQTGTADGAHVFVSDFFDFSVFVDADVEHIRQWYVERFHVLRETAFQDPASYFRRFADLDRQQTEALAREIWHDINERNLHENILPTRPRADLILHKGADHTVEEVRLRRL